MSIATQPAVLLIFFNRPDCAERSLAAIRAARPRRLYLVTDAPRPDVATDHTRCAATRELVERGVDWPCEVFKNYAPTNLGPQLRIVSGITWLFDHEERAIILEEDCVPDVTFFKFCEELLDRYADDTRVGMISGDQFVPGGWPTADSYRFVRLSQIWGWATWRRAWKNFDEHMALWPDAAHRGFLTKIFRLRRDRKYWHKRLAQCHRGELTVWDYQWAFARWAHDQLGIIPSRNLVSYIGFRPDALHTVGPHPCADLPTVPMVFPLRHPISVVADHALDAATARLLFYEGNWFSYHWGRFSTRLHKFFSHA